MPGRRQTTLGLDTVPGYRRVDNITDWCRQQFRTQYPALQIAKDDIWSYLYGLLHAPDYRAKYRNDLAKDLPRIPFASDFGAFRDAGQRWHSCTWVMRLAPSMSCR